MSVCPCSLLAALDPPHLHIVDVRDHIFLLLKNSTGARQWRSQKKNREEANFPLSCGPLLFPVLLFPPLSLQVGPVIQVWVSSRSGYRRSPAAERHVMQFGLKKASDKSNFMYIFTKNNRKLDKLTATFLVDGPKGVHGPNGPMINTPLCLIDRCQIR